MVQKKATNGAKEYQAGDIIVLEGLDAVRKRPGMYIGTTGPRGLHHLVWEIVDNAIDEIANGYADAVEITLHRDGSCSVFDNGRGIPTDIHPQKGVSGVEVVFTQLHAGGKFEGGTYSYSGGLHGVGASVVNALSQWLVCEVYQDGFTYRQEFSSRVDSVSGKLVGGKPVAPLQRLGPTRKRGTLITFLPDPVVFEDTRFAFDTITRRLRELAFLNRGARMVLTDERERVEGKYKRQEFHYEGGICDFVSFLNQDKQCLHPSPILIEGRKDDMLIQIAMQYTDSYTENVFSFVNNIPTPEGGTHETGFKSALTRVMNECARAAGVLKDKDANLAGEDFREGLTVVLSMKMKNVQFEGQTKTRLGNMEARAAVEAVVNEKLQLYLDDVRNQETFNKMLEKAISSARVRDAARKAKALARRRNSLESAPLVGKLASCTGRRAAENELYIVEGDSAGGSAKQARDRAFQAILPLRGKPLNAEKKRLDEVLANEEFRTIISALGTGIDEDFDLRDLKYHKIIILADADQDGAHIRAILLTFFFRYMRALITNGHVYLGMPPLYKLSKGSKTFYAYDDRELKEATKKLGRGYSLQRYKGLGEMNPEQLWDTTMSPANRTLVRVTIEDAAEAEHIVRVLMGDRVEPRRDYISLHANFNRVDTFVKEEGIADGQA